MASRVKFLLMTMDADEHMIKNGVQYLEMCLHLPSVKKSSDSKEEVALY